MKYIKSILAAAIIASVGGFVIWHLMWMTGIEKRFRAEQFSGPADITAVKENKGKGHREKTEKNRSVSEGGAASVQEGRTQIDQAEKPFHESERTGGIRAGPGAGLPGNGTTPEPEQGAGKWFKKVTGPGNRQVKSEPGETAIEISNDKPLPATINNKTGQAMPKNIQQPQQARMPDVKVRGVTSYPTSTAP